MERRTDFPTNPPAGQTFFLTTALGDLDPGMYTYQGTEWAAGSGGNPYADAKDSVRVASTEAITVLNGVKTVDGIILAHKDRVLLKNQLDAKTNGIYEVVASGPWVRPKDASNDKGITAGLYVFVAEGAANAGTGWVLITPDPIVANTTDLYFSQFSGTGNISAGTGLMRVGNAFQLIPTGVVPAVYKSVTIDQFGRVIEGSSPSTLNGYGITDAQSTLTGAVTSIANNNLLASRVVTTDASGKITQSAVTAADLAAVKASNDALPGLLSAKQSTVTGAASSVVGVNLAPNVLVGTDGLGKLVATAASLTEVGFLSGTTSNVQAQVDTKVSKSGGTLTGALQIAVVPTDPKDLTNKQYVDQRISGLASQPRSIFATVPGDVVAFEGALRWYPPFPITVSACRIFQGTPPTLTPTIVDVKKNGVTVFASTKPTLEVGMNKSVLLGADTFLTIDDYLLIDVDQGSGADLSIRVDYTTV